MSDEIRDTLRGDAEPLRRYGVSMVDVPWWRKRIQRHVMPKRFLFWLQKRILEADE